MTEVAPTQERSKLKIERVDFKKFVPDATLNFLDNSWQGRPLSQEHVHEFQRGLGTERAAIIINTEQRTVNFYGPEVEGRTDSEIELEDVRKVELNYPNGFIKFEGRSGIYEISKDGRIHFLQSKDKKLLSVRRLQY